MGIGKVQGWWTGEGSLGFVADPQRDLGNPMCFGVVTKFRFENFVMARLGLGWRWAVEFL